MFAWISTRSCATHTLSTIRAAAALAPPATAPLASAQAAAKVLCASLTEANLLREVAASKPGHTALVGALDLVCASRAAVSLASALAAVPPASSPFVTGTGVATADDGRSALLNALLHGSASRRNFAGAAAAAAALQRIPGGISNDSRMGGASVCSEAAAAWLRACTAVGRHAEATALLEGWLSRSALRVPDSAVLAAALAAASGGGDFRAVTATWARLVAGQPPGRAPVVPRADAYAAYAEAAAVAGLRREALAVLDRMRVAGLRPNLMVYSACMRACSLTARPAAAFSLFDDAMREAAGDVSDEGDAAEYALFTLACTAAHGAGAATAALASEATEAAFAALPSSASPRVWSALALAAARAGNDDAVARALAACRIAAKSAGSGSDSLEHLAAAYTASMSLLAARAASPALAEPLDAAAAADGLPPSKSLAAARVRLFAASRDAAGATAAANAAAAAGLQVDAEIFVPLLRSSSSAARGSGGGLVAVQSPILQAAAIAGLPARALAAVVEAATAAASEAGDARAAAAALSAADAAGAPPSLASLEHALIAAARGDDVALASDVAARMRTRGYQPSPVALEVVRSAAAAEEAGVGRPRRRVRAPPHAPIPMNELLSAADAATVDADAPFPIPAPAHGALADFIRVHSRLAAEREAWLRESGDAAADAEVAADDSPPPAGAAAAATEASVQEAPQLPWDQEAHLRATFAGALLSRSASAIGAGGGSTPTSAAAAQQQLASLVSGGAARAAAGAPERLLGGGAAGNVKAPFSPGPSRLRRARAFSEKSYSGGFGRFPSVALDAHGGGGSRVGTGGLPTLPFVQLAAGLRVPIPRGLRPMSEAAVRKAKLAGFAGDLALPASVVDDEAAQGELRWVQREVRGAHAAKAALAAAEASATDSEVDGGDQSAPVMAQPVAQPESADDGPAHDAVKSGDEEEAAAAAVAPVRGRRRGPMPRLRGQIGVLANGEVVLDGDAPIYDGPITSDDEEQEGEAVLAPRQRGKVLATAYAARLRTGAVAKSVLPVPPPPQSPENGVGAPRRRASALFGEAVVTTRLK